jgi:hypothetical protein
MPTAEDILDRITNRILLSERQVRETRRTVYLADQRYVIKQFELPAGAIGYRRPWEIEARALRRLDGHLAPRCFGFVERIADGTRTVSLIKHYVPGQTCTTFTRDNLPALAALMAGLHNRLVVTDDANVHNFLHTPDGKLLFIDLGRARLFDAPGPRLWVAIGAELAKLRREGFGWDRTLWTNFLPAYVEQLAGSRTAHSMIRWSYAAALVSRMARKTLKGKSRWS